MLSVVAPYFAMLSGRLVQTFMESPPDQLWLLVHQDLISVLAPDVEENKRKLVLGHLANLAFFRLTK